MKAIVWLLSGVALLQACASPLPQQPKALREAEQNMQRGTAAYVNDEYHLAANAFTNALDIYQSIDNGDGVFEATVNLLQTSLAVVNLQAARQQLATLRALTAQRVVEAEKMRIDLLEVRLLHAEGKPDQALAILRPLWPRFDEQQRVVEDSEFALPVVAATARLMQQTRHADSALWLTRLQQFELGEDASGQRYRALLLRLQAKQPSGPDSEQQLREALGIYRELVYRRGIAITLQQLAALKASQDEWQAADDLYQRSLKVHLWTLNKQQAVEVLQALIAINERLEDVAEAAMFKEQLRRLQASETLR
jgi:tetratricopeptide (TPR) repeat protein